MLYIDLNSLVTVGSDGDLHRSEANRFPSENNLNAVRSVIETIGDYRQKIVGERNISLDSGESISEYLIDGEKADLTLLYKQAQKVIGLVVVDSIHESMELYGGNSEDISKSIGVQIKNVIDVARKPYNIPDNEIGDFFHCGMHDINIWNPTICNIKLLKLHDVLFDLDKLNELDVNAGYYNVGVRSIENKTV